MSNHLEIRLRTRIDRNGDEYLIGSATDLPLLVDLRDTTFLVFYPREDEGEELGDEEDRDNTKYATLMIRKYQPPRYLQGTDEGR